MSECYYLKSRKRSQTRRKKRKIEECRGARGERTRRTGRKGERARAREREENVFSHCCLRLKSFSKSSLAEKSSFPQLNRNQQPNLTHLMCLILKLWKEFFPGSDALSGQHWMGWGWLHTITKVKRIRKKDIREITGLSTLDFLSAM